MIVLRHSHPAAWKIPRAVCVSALFVGAVNMPAAGAEWTITPQVAVEQSVTDNARSTSTDEKADLISTASAGISVDGIGRHLQLSFDYSISQDKFWDNSDLDGFRQSMLGAGRMSVYEDYVFLDTRASLSQQSLQRNGGEAATDRTIGTNDQTTILNYSITPNYAYRYGNWAESDVRISYNQIQFLESDVGSAAVQPEDSRTISFETLVRSGPNFSRNAWQLIGNTNFTDDNSDRDLLEFSNEYAWTRHFSLLGRVGREVIENAGINADDSATIFWRGGARLTPGPRSSIRVEYGRRFDEPVFSGDAIYRFSSRTTVLATYEVTVQTDRERLTQNLNNLVLNNENVLVDPITGLPGSPNSSEFDFEEQATKEERFTIALNGARGRNTFGLNSSVATRTELAADTEETIVTFGGNINRRIWPDLTGGIVTSYSATTESDIGVEDMTVNGGMFLRYSIFEDVTGTLQYNFLYRDSDVDTNDLRENVISVGLSKTF
ncbi:MAG: TIGR03016 family PEP-CTERM system-associated outer membrane protein [Alphaproteobacteria bacterium]